MEEGLRKYIDKFVMDQVLESLRRGEDFRNSLPRIVDQFGRIVERPGKTVGDVVNVRKPKRFQKSED